MESTTDFTDDRKTPLEELSRKALSLIHIYGIAVIVNPQNPLEEITSEQVNAVYTGKAAAWDELN